ncbi:galactose-binding domain-like protein [Lasiosphaeris hirsuta]|uniref:Galactose-binding domain-like protein n=1 Tax=Lasiosphaeris hirsuta TaxID=260670 RepID=A0AA40A7V1_9PEZI|nr:galactose-binding domain-like protein [Lasiosphaeris hirsuta]
MSITLAQNHPVFHQQVRRRALGELNPNRDLNKPRGKSRRAPITFDQENEEAVLEGIQLGTYDVQEVMALTNFRLPAPIGDAHDSDNEDFTRDLNAGLRGSAFSNDDAEARMDAEYGGADDDDDLGGDLGDDLGDDEVFGEVMDEDHENDEHIDSDAHLQGPPFDPSAIGLKEINNLAHFGVSSHKPGNGVAELLSDDLDKYWQSDGQQPHLLTIHFLRRVEIRAIRFYVDYNKDESYTPTHVIFYAGTGHHDLIQFAEVPLTNPVGWQNVPIRDCGGGPDGHSLCCWIVQVHVKENHQNGKDTHIRGIKIFALDENSVGSAVGDAVHEMEQNIDNAAGRVDVTNATANEDETFQELLDSIDFGHSRFGAGETGFSNYPDFMRDPEIR